MLNKTLKENVKKTKSAHKFIAIVVIALVLSVVIALSIPNNKKAVAPVTSSTTCQGLETNDGCYDLERVVTESTRQQGLSDRSSLPMRSGMLFVFEKPTRQCFWMKDMRFNIDIIWLDEAKTITRIEPNVNPATYPESFCKDNTKYVLELNANDAQKLQLTSGQQLTF